MSSLKTLILKTILTLHLSETKIRYIYTISVLSSYARLNTISDDCLLLKANKSASKRVVRAHTMHGLWLLQEGNYCN